VAGQQHGDAARLRLADDLGEDRLHEGVEAGGRLVEDEQLSVGRECCDDRDLLPVAFRVLASALGRVELESLEEFAPASLVQSPAQRTEQVDRLSPGHARPQGDVAGDVGEAAVEFDDVLPRVAAEHGRPARVGS